MLRNPGNIFTAANNPVMQSSAPDVSTLYLLILGFETIIYFVIFLMFAQFAIDEKICTFCKLDFLYLLFARYAQSKQLFFLKLWLEFRVTIADNSKAGLLKGSFLKLKSNR